MKKHTKEIVFKCVVLLGIISILLLFPGCLIWAFLITDPCLGEAVAYGLLASCFVFGLATCIMLPFCYDVLQKPQKAYVYPCPSRTYDEFLRVLVSKLEQKNYQKLFECSSDKSFGEEVYMYVKHERKQGLLCVAIIRNRNLTKLFLEEVNKKITKALRETYGESANYKSVNVMSIFCVDQINPVFRNMLYGTLYQGFKNGRIIAGVSFGGKKIYIAKQKGGAWFYKYKYLKKEIKELLSIPVA